MKSIHQVLDSFDFIQNAKKLAKERELAAAKANVAADKSNANAEIAYRLLKFDMFDVDNFLSDNIGVSRDKMPQIPDNEIDRILIHFMKRHGGVRKEIVPIVKLRPTQNEINMDKVRDMIKSDSTRYKDRVYIVSKDFKLMDGHHDCVHCLIVEPDANVTVYRSKLTADRMLNILRRLKYTTIKDINDKPVAA